MNFSSDVQLSDNLFVSSASAVLLSIVYGAYGVQILCCCLSVTWVRSGCVMCCCQWCQAVNDVPSMLTEKKSVWFNLMLLWLCLSAFAVLI